MTNKMTIHSILLVEDEAPLANVLTDELKNNGFSVVHAENGDAALEDVKKKQFDLILCDIVMPEMDGFETLENMRKANITTPVIMLTNLSQEEEKAKAKKLGALDYIVKSATSLADIIQKIKSIS
ncbi:MAG: response regulator [Candidatus Saccharibacteria bacterium]